MDAEIPTNEPLQSLDYAIVEALRNGASPEDVARIVASASLKLHPSKIRPKKYPLEMKTKEGYFVPSRALYLIGFVVLALVLALNNIATSCFMLSAMKSPQLGFEPPNDIPKNPSKNTFDNNHDETKNSTDIQIDDEESKLRLYVNPEKKDFDFHELLLNVKKDDLDHSCPLDTFFNDACRTRAGGTVCVYHDTILKKIEKGYIDREITAIQRLTDPRFFPKVYHIDEKCATVVLENVRPKHMVGDYNNMCANYTYYEDFYKSAFDIFNEQNIIPQDLNTCCNTIILDDYIKIIDFGQYQVDKPPEEVRERNEKLLEEILADLKKSVEGWKPRCRKKREKEERKRKEEEERQKEEERKKEEKRQKEMEQKKEEERKQELKQKQEEETKETK